MEILKKEEFYLFSEFKKFTFGLEELLHFLKKRKIEYRFISNKYDSTLCICVDLVYSYKSFLIRFELNKMISLSLNLFLDRESLEKFDELFFKTIFQVKSFLVEKDPVQWTVQNLEDPLKGFSLKNCAWLSDQTLVLTQTIVYPDIPTIELVYSPMRIKKSQIDKSTKTSFDISQAARSIIF